MNFELLDNEKLVYSIINKFNYHDKEDLFQAGIIGLLDAYKHYNTNFDTKFSTYAYTYIYGEVIKYVRENKPIKVSKDVIKLSKSLEKAKDILRQKLLREPTKLELSIILDIDEDKIEEIENIPKDVLSLDQEYQDGNDLYNKISINDKNTSPEIMDLKKEIDLLESDEKKLIYSRYFCDLTQSETSRKLGISQVQVSRKETKVLQKLRTRL